MKKYCTSLLSLLSFISLALPNASLANYAIVLPGQHEQGNDLQGSAISADNVIDWEIDNRDLVFGAYGNKSDNEKANSIGYMYNQKLELNSGALEDEIRNTAEKNNIDYEDFFLHFSEDTILAELDTTHGENTLLSRKPMIVGYTADEKHAGYALYQQPPWDADVFEHFERGGALYVYHSEKFDSLTFEFSRFAQGGEFHIEYPTSTNDLGQSTTWARLDIINDHTQNMTQSQALSWRVPSNWVRATTHDGSGQSYGGGQYFGSTFVRDGGRLYVVRIRWQSSSSDIRPRLNQVQLKDSFPKFDIKNLPFPIPNTDSQSFGKAKHWRKIHGFDQAADLNRDNYLSPSEYQNRTNKSATARFRWESRVIPFGRMWNQNSSWALTNLTNPQLLSAVQAYYSKHWAQQGLRGAYNDDTNKLMGSNQFEVYMGGKVSEMELIVGSDDADQVYQTQFTSFLQNLTAHDSNPVVGLNIGTANLYGRHGQSHLIKAGNVYLREHYLFPSTGFSGYAGLSKFWDNSALAHSKQNVIFQATTRFGRVEYFGNNEENWKQDQYSTLAIFYLNYHPKHSYFNQWNSGYVYGSNNTTKDNFWKSGIPKNMAYRPTALLAVDLGSPTHSIPQGFEAIPLMLSTSSPQPADYTIVGNASQEHIEHADLPNGKVQLLPTHSYFVYQSDHYAVEGGPQDMVLAREFEHGRVLYRTDFHGQNSDFYSAPKLSIPLKKPMRPVDANGDIGDYVNEVKLGGYQGLFLLY
ncbi:hypothetical protein [Vibrio lentus]|uniref:Porin n=1 Tax=Vibrio lentus TaxID=136468 RepID=A0A2N7IGQ0_9VIBR|nr:hypothetical protein [Vibrio lentus]PML56403.1 hypothetical protein BCT74_20945 [Vibrio lentus]PMM24411.1 hypothetical protein BCT58_12740 [Vibrio lentus]